MSKNVDREKHQMADGVVWWGLGTASDPIQYEVNDALLNAVREGNWNTGMLDALVSEVERLRRELDELYTDVVQLNDEYRTRDRTYSALEEMAAGGMHIIPPSPDGAYSRSFQIGAAQIRNLLAEAARRVEERDD